MKMIIEKKKKTEKKTEKKTRVPNRREEEADRLAGDDSDILVGISVGHPSLRGFSAGRSPAV
jgi:hypothetical protein